MIPHDTYPWQSHRTIREVAETETLRERRKNGTLPDHGKQRLQALEARAVEPERDGQP